MKVLLSAYACEPNKGSEPGVGWHWAMEIARLGHEVWVLTCANNRAAIEMELAKSPSITNLRFLYYNLPLWTQSWEKSAWGIYPYYFLWQWGAYHLAKRIHAMEGFDRVHHITFGGFRQPSFMGNLGIPFFFGPVGGGETAPWRLRMGYSPRGWIKDVLRDISNFVIRFDPLMLATFRQAQLIYVKTPQSRETIPKKFRKKIKCQLEVGIDSRRVVGRNKGQKENDQPFCILYVGRFICWKGMHLGLAAFKSLLSSIPDARLTMVGRGPDEQHWQRLAERLKISQNIDWISWVPQEELTPLYQSHDVFLFPSLHDSSGNVILESLSHGLPIVCLDLGGPGEMVDDTCGFKVETDGLNEKATIQALADRLIRLAGDPTLLRRLSNGAIQRVKKFSWSSVVHRIYKNGN